MKHSRCYIKYIVKFLSCAHQNQIASPSFLVTSSRHTKFRVEFLPACARARASNELKMRLQAARLAGPRRNLRITFPLPPIFIPLCSSHIQSLKLNYLSCAFQATAFALPSTTKPLIHTAISTTIHRIPATHATKSLPYSQLLRLRRICSNQADFLDKAQEMASFFERCGYSAQTLKHDLEKTKHFSQSDALSNSNPTEEKMNRIPLILTYHPLNTRVQRILLDNFKPITDDPATRLIFP